MRALEDIAVALGKEGDPVEICLIGSATCLLNGMDGRTSVDLNVWMPNSKFDELEFKRAVLDAGLLFNPISEEEPDRTYIQLVEPGIVQLGTFESVLIKKLGRLLIKRPPHENIIASKLTRANLKDIQDIHFLMQTYRPNRELIEQIIQTLPPADRDIATENLVYLDILK